MKTTSLMTAVAMAAVLFALHSQGRWEARLLEVESELAAAKQAERRLARRLGSPRPAPVAAAPPQSVECRCPQPEPCPDAVGQLVTPEGTALKSAADREQYVRETLRRRLVGAFALEEMDEATRSRVIDLLAQVRDLRSQQSGHGLDDSTPPALREELYARQMELDELTGMGVAEFLDVLQEGEPGVSTRPDGATGVLEGEVRKRFADEVAVQLGIVEPGSVEVLEDGEWRSE